MRHDRSSCRRSALAIALTVFAFAPAAQAQAQAPDAAAANAVEAANRVAAAGAGPCNSTLERERTTAEPTTFREVTPFRPAGYEVRTFGQQGIYSSDTFQADWLVEGPNVHPQNIPAARLADGCGDSTISPQQPLDWHRLSYLEPSTGNVSIGSNQAWSGANVQEPVVPYVGGRPLEDPIAPIWALSCTKGAQTATFRRTVYLLGPPRDLVLTVANVSRNYSKWPFTSAEVRLNGTRIYQKTTPGDGGGRLTDDQLGLVRFGPNNLVLTMRKRRTARCNGDRPLQIAVLFALSGEQGSDLSVSRPAPTTHTGDVDPIRAIDFFSVPYTLANAGPSTVLEPVIVFRTTFFPTPTDALAFAAGEGASCTQGNRDPITTYTIVCALGPLEAGGKRTVGAAFAAKPPNKEPPYKTVWRTDWDFNGVMGDAPGEFCVPKGQDCATLQP